MPLFQRVIFDQSRTNSPAVSVNLVHLRVKRIHACQLSAQTKVIEQRASCALFPSGCKIFDVDRTAERENSHSCKVWSAPGHGESRCFTAERLLTNNAVNHSCIFQCKTPEILCQVRCQGHHLTHNTCDVADCFLLVTVLLPNVGRFRVQHKSILRPQFLHVAADLLSS